MTEGRIPPYTVVSFHAHPDDEAMLTAGTLAAMASAGHRVVLVVATAGEAGLVSSDVAGRGPVGVRRMAELEQAAAVLGCARTVLLGYADSGLTAPTRADARSTESGLSPFAHADVDGAARRLATILVEEDADLLTVYDPVGGYGHPDHVQVHRVGCRAADLAGTPSVLAATVDRSRLRLAARLVALLGRVGILGAGLQIPDFSGAYTARAALTHRVDVRAHLAAKRAAMAAHASQASSDWGTRSLAFYLRLRAPLFRLAFGFEWYVERGRAPSRQLAGDPFDSLRSGVVTRRTGEQG